MSLFNVLLEILVRLASLTWNGIYSGQSDKTFVFYKVSSVPACSASVYQLKSAPLTPHLCLSHKISVGPQPTLHCQVPGPVKSAMCSLLYSSMDSQGLWCIIICKDHHLKTQSSQKWRLTRVLPYVCGLLESLRCILA